jgi:hypothetical protein
MGFGFSRFVQAIAIVIMVSSCTGKKPSENDQRAGSEVAGLGASDPGAIVYLPTSDDDFEIREWGTIQVVDSQNETGLSGTRSGGSIGDSFHWTIRSAKGNYDTILNVHGVLSEGFRKDVGLTRAFTITHAYPETYFPYRDAVYQKDFPLERFASMLNTASRFNKVTRKIAPEDKRDLVVIDNRESYRAKNNRLALEEKSSDIRIGKIQIARKLTLPTGVTAYIPKPDPAVKFDPDAQETKLVDGSSFRAKRAGDRDYYFYKGVWHDAASGRNFVLTIHLSKAWRPGYGETEMLAVNRMSDDLEDMDLHREGNMRITEAEVPITALIPLLNAYQTFSFQRKNVGHFIIVDQRAKPHNYYYG